MNNTSCPAGDLISEHYRILLPSIYSAVGTISVIVCLTAVILIVVLKLYRYFVYRLAVYQVLSAMLFGVVCIMELVAIYYDKDPASLYHGLCQFVGYLLVFSVWMKFFFTVWLTFHLFVFSVCFKNLKKLEPLYIVSSIVVPAAIAAVPLTTNSYGLAQGWCQMKNWNGDCSSDIQRAGNIELLAIGFVPLAIVLALNSTAVAVMVVILTTRACYYKRKETLLGSTGNNYTQQLKALKEILPLIAYPILLLILFMPPFITRVYNTKPHPLNEVNALLVVAALGLSAGATLIIHVIVVSYLNYQRRRKQSKILSYGSANAADHETIQVTNTSNVPSYTYFSIPVED